MKTLTILALIICINPYRTPKELRKSVRGYKQISIPGYFEKTNQQGLC